MYFFLPLSRLVTGKNLCLLKTLAELPSQPIDADQTVKIMTLKIRETTYIKTTIQACQDAIIFVLLQQVLSSSLLRHALTSESDQT